MAISNQLPRSICIEKKEFALDWDKRLGGKNVRLSEVGYHKNLLNVAVSRLHRLTKSIIYHTAKDHQIKPFLPGEEI